MIRPSINEWGLRLAELTAQRSTCLRRAVGAVLLDAAGHILATGYNGVATGLPHCNEPTSPGQPGDNGPVYAHACSGAFSPSGTNLDGCQAIHAEQNALLQCRDVSAIRTCCISASPCITCVKLLLNTACEEVVFAEEYPHQSARVLWVSSGRTWTQLSLDP